MYTLETPTRGNAKTIISNSRAGLEVPGPQGTSRILAGIILARIILVGIILVGIILVMKV